jgi:hypothetical protein
VIFTVVIHDAFSEHLQLSKKGLHAASCEQQNGNRQTCDARA